MNNQSTTIIVYLVVETLTTQFGFSHNSEPLKVFSKREDAVNFVAEMVQKNINYTYEIKEMETE